MENNRRFGWQQSLQSEWNLQCLREGIGSSDIEQVWSDDFEGLLVLSLVEYFCNNGCFGNTTCCVFLLFVLSRVYDSSESKLAIWSKTSLLWREAVSESEAAKKRSSSYRQTSSCNSRYRLALIWSYSRARSSWLRCLSWSSNLLDSLNISF